MQIKQETRSNNLELRVASVPGNEYTKIITGRAIPFNTRSELLGGSFYEVIKPGAVNLDNSSDIRLLVNHNSDFLLARTSSGTLKLRTTDTGVLFEATIDTRQSYAADLAISIERTDTSGTSFGMFVDPQDQEWTNENGTPLRTINKLSAFEISIVNDPAYKINNAVDLRSCPSDIRSLMPASDADGVDEMEAVKMRIEIAQRQARY